MVGKIIVFAQSDSFWRSNILSGKKLREKYDQLYLRAREMVEKTTIPQFDGVSSL